MKKILHVGGAMRIGGAERALFQLIAAQRAQGDTVDLVTTSAAGYYANEVSKKCGAAIHEIQQKHSFDFRNVLLFIRVVKKYDIIHFHIPNPALMLACLFVPDKIKLFYTHRAGRHAYPLTRRFVYQAAGFCIRYKFTGVSGNTAFAASVAAELFKIDSKQVTTTYNGIDFDLLRPKRSRQQVLEELGEDLTDTRIRLVTTGNFRPLKRVDHLLRSLASLNADSFIFYAIGDGPEMSDLASLTESLGITDRVRFLGKKTQVGDYLQISDIFILPSDQSESFGNSAVEAMGVGIPTIVMRDGGGLVEHIAEGGGFIADTFVHLSGILSQLIGSEDLRRRVGAAGKDYVCRKYTYENMVQGYEQLYTSGQMRHVRH